jgi:Flp pilus assembly protein TadB
MQKLMIGLTAALAILLAGSAQSAFAGSKKSSANQPNHTATATTSKQSNHTATATTSKQSNHTVTSTHSKRTTSTKKSSATRVRPNANGKHIPEASITVRKTRGNDWNCILFPSLCVGPRLKAQQAH